MPATKRLQEHDEKRAEIVSAARRLFIDHGYEHTPMNKLAQAAGVAGNTIYWYFTDKDDVLIAVLNDVMNDAIGDYQDVAARPLEDQLLWAVGQLQEMRRLVSTVHARIRASPAINEWHDAFHVMTEGLLRVLLEQAGANGANVDAEVKIAVFAIEGILTHELDAAQQRAICHRLAEPPI